METCIPVFSPVCTAIGLGVVSLFALWVLWQVFRGLVYMAGCANFGDRRTVNKLELVVDGLKDDRSRDATRFGDSLLELQNRIYDLENKGKKNKK